MCRSLLKSLLEECYILHKVDDLNITIFLKISTTCVTTSTVSILTATQTTKILKEASYHRLKRGSVNIDNNNIILDNAYSVNIEDIS